jgi:PilZ domain
VSKIVSMPDRSGNAPIRVPGVRDRRYTLRYPFAADAQLIDLESGRQLDGVTSDISFGGCFVCTSKPLSVNARARLKLIRKDQLLEALVTVRIVKPRVGMGIEFFDLDPHNSEILASWIDSLRLAR